MAATQITKIAWPGPYPTALTALTPVAADVTNGNAFKMSGDDLLLVFGGSAGGTYTVQGPANARNRTGTISAKTIAIGAIHVLGPFKKLDGWQNSDGLRIQASVVTIKLAVLRLRG